MPRSARASVTSRLFVVPIVLALLATTACWPTDPPPNCGEPPDFDLAAGEQAQADPDCPDDPPPPPPLPPGPPLPPPDCPVGNCGPMTGDPHLQTFDGVTYDFHADGEFVAARSTADDYEVQARLSEYVGNTSVVAAVAARVGEHRVTFTSDHEPVVRVDGEDLPLEDGQSVELDDGTVVDFAGVTYRVTWPDGVRNVFVTHYSSSFDAYTVIDDSQHGRLEGLLGGADGEPVGDLESSDGAVLPSDPEFDDLYPAYADSWRITDETSLFDYEDGESTETHTNLDFPEGPASLDDLAPDVRADAERICRDAGVTNPVLLEQCMLDVGLSGDESFATSAALQQQLRSGGAVTGTAALGWAEVVDGLAWSQSRLVEDGAGHLLANGRDEVSGNGLLVALDDETGTEAWQLADVASNCSPTVTDDGDLVVQFARRTATVGEDNDNAELRLVDPEDGTLVEDGPTIALGEDERIGECTSRLVWVDGMVVLYDATNLEAYTVGTDVIERAWSHDFVSVGAEVPVISADGSSVYWVHRGDGTPVLEKIDLESGEIVDSVDIPGTQDMVSGRSMIADADGVTVSMPDRPDVSGHIIRVLDDGELEIDWVVDTGGPDADEGQRLPPPVLVVSGDRVVGYTDSAVVSAFELDDGDLAWTYQATSFNNSGGELYADNDGNVYLASFGGDWIESTDGEGQLRWGLTVEDLFGDPQAEVGGVISIGPLLDDGSVVVVSAAAPPLVSSVVQD